MSHDVTVEGVSGKRRGSVVVVQKKRRRNVEEGVNREMEVELEGTTGREGKEG